MDLKEAVLAIDRHLPFAGRMIGPFNFVSFAGYVFGAFLLGIATDFLSYRIHRGAVRLWGRLKARSRSASRELPPLRPTTRCDPSALAALREEAARTERAEATTVSMPVGWTPPSIEDGDARTERSEAETMSAPRPAAGSPRTL